MPLRLALFFSIVLATSNPIAASAGAPAELVAALKAFRADPPAGWSFTQTTISGAESMVERCDAAKPIFNRWSLVEKDGRPPTADELSEYAEIRSRRSRSGTAPNVTDQIDITSIQSAGDAGERATYHARLVPGESRDHTARHLRVTIVYHRPSRTVETLELASIEPFSPTIGVSIATMKTTMRYSLPSADAPALPRDVTTHVRGRAFWLKSLDADMTVTFSDYSRAGKR